MMQITHPPIGETPMLVAEWLQGRENPCKVFVPWMWCLSGETR